MNSHVSPLDALPAHPGSYVLLLHVAHSRTLAVGRLEGVYFPAGFYAYAGSARGPGGLRARVGRHLRGDGRVRWHIDYLRAVAEVRAGYYLITDRSLECEWSQALAALPNARIPVVGFGASDCRAGCRAHLIQFPQDFDLAVIQHTLAKWDSPHCGGYISTSSITPA
jgi:Uri superfamily endonuclease